MTTATATPLSVRVCAYCDQPIKGLAHRLHPGHPESKLVGLGHDDCYGSFLDALLVGAGSADGASR